jgi:SAM-dependent methyltransferase
MPWRSRLNAEIYDRFVRERDVYRWLNRHLVELAEVEEARRILDLACGTGATSLACLERMPARAESVGVDASEGMVAVARSNVHDPRARFLVAAASEVASLDGDFDRVVCNAAFWQFPFPGAVFAALGERTAKGGLLVFNVPAERLVGEPRALHSFQVALRQEIQSLRAGGHSGDEPIEAASLDALARDGGFELETRERFVYRGRQQELIELMSIPAMIGRVAVGLSEELRELALERARRRVDPDEQVKVPWVYFLYRRR